MGATAPSAPTALAAIRLSIRDAYGIMPHPYFRWAESSPARHLPRLLLLGQMEIAPLTREVLREADPNPRLRQWVQIG
ncbi:hypothetical protein ACTXOR_13515 [Arthrobacter rhombi]|uniref:hypothetical protein n=1 Tax=Arthrobacter rhombi TaxID=71253 RepID=UPI003FD0F07C